ncbi:undecaprenyl-diphosphate phosphatase [Pseudooceanicola nanhaiensis]|uniref:undecaprenyl-diphosphate phosphatase n=1 Tax=Pseudooceanicola nanhaiensis TaxID=375761 RepID=UPI001CD79D33|nr:undecaprenyl-diphosphate phosphatase [Pseudooceanicola nanhaiensis]MCA0920492.1 undecaprenyl-diphosphate phosphatase [Pseudooceanicola nanhaiensis]
MTLLHLLLLAVVQGVTEFLPISSSGHLILIPALTGASDQGQAIDVAVHVGTLGAVILYFWADVRDAAIGLPRALTGRMDTPGAKLAFLLIISTIPVVLFGLILKATGLDELLRSATVIAATMIGFGLLLYWADQRKGGLKEDREWTVRDALIMGLWQAVALIPGTSRSGITITSALMLGYTRRDAAKLSMLMSIPTIIASALYLAAEVVATHEASFRDMGIAALFAFLSALVALTLMMRLLRSVSYTPYVIYRLVLGVALLVWVYA